MVLPFIGVSAKEKAPQITEKSSQTEVISADSTDRSVIKKIMPTDSAIVKGVEKVANSLRDTSYKPDPTKAVWLSALCPGLGQIYNHRYWKLPIVGAATAAMTYAISWNNKYYVAYTNAYIDYSDDDQNTNSFEKLLPNASKYNASNLTTILKNRQQVYRRYRDLSIIGAVGVYIFCILDAYVDAQLYDFDVTPDLAVHPSLKPCSFGGAKGVELSLSFNF
jgi:hypothetical protein